MKGAAAIIVVLSATALLAAADKHVPYYAQKYVDEIVVSLRKLTEATSKLSNDLLISSKNYKAPPSDSGKLALASQLISTAGNLRLGAMLEAIDSGKIQGNDFQQEIEWFTMQQHKADSLIEPKLEALIKLADDLPDSGLHRYVRELVEGLKAHRTLLYKMLKDGPN